jgi:hypothetical protein
MLFGIGAYVKSAMRPGKEYFVNGTNILMTFLFSDARMPFLIASGNFSVAFRTGCRIWKRNFGSNLRRRRAPEYTPSRIESTFHTF